MFIFGKSKLVIFGISFLVIVSLSYFTLIRANSEDVITKQQLLSTGTWERHAMASRNDRFTVQFDVVPVSNTEKSLIGIYNNSRKLFSALVEFDTSGSIYSSNGKKYASYEKAAFTNGKKYHFRFVFNVPRQTYSAYVTQEGNWYETILAMDYKFFNSEKPSYSIDSMGVKAAIKAVTVSDLVCRPFSITKPVLFDAPEGDKILNDMRIFPEDSAWNTDISKLPVQADSSALISTIGADSNIGFNRDMNYVFVPPDQKRISIVPGYYREESDYGLWPVPPEAPVENWPLRINEDTGALPDPGESFDTFQRYGTGDRHVSVIDPDAGMLYELYNAYKTDTGWKCNFSSCFDLKTNAMRPDRYSSTDAAGFPIFPAVIKYSDVAGGMVNHAMRFTVRNTRREFVYPATHYASQSRDLNYPRMGERFRLKQDYDISKFPPHVQAILKGLKKYGMFVCDNGSNWLLSISPDSRIQGLDTLKRLKGSDFEVVDTRSLPNYKSIKG